MLTERNTVYVIDDDASVREGLDSLLRSFDFDVQSYSCTRDVTFDGRQRWPSCIVLDVRMPRETGIAFQARLMRMGISTPIVFITGYGDVPTCAGAMKAGAVDFLLKPFKEHDLLDAITRAVRRSRTAQDDAARLFSLRSRFATLTAREKQVMSLVVTGRLNKQIASLLGLSEIAIKVNRGQVMRKMAASSVADLVRMADRLGLDADHDELALATRTRRGH